MGISSDTFLSDPDDYRITLDVLLWTRAARVPVVLPTWYDRDGRPVDFQAALGVALQHVVGFCGRQCILIPGLRPLKKPPTRAQRNTAMRILDEIDFVPAHSSELLLRRTAMSMIDVVGRLVEDRKALAKAWQPPWDRPQEDDGLDDNGDPIEGTVYIINGKRVSEHDPASPRRFREPTSYHHRGDGLAGDIGRDDGEA